jgi:hypothetical protein
LIRSQGGSNDWSATLNYGMQSPGLAEIINIIYTGEHSILLL